MTDRFATLFTDFGPKIPGVIVGVLVGYLLIKFTTFSLRRVLKFMKLNKSLLDFITSLTSVILWVILTAEISRQLGLTGLALTISGSIVALGFALANGASILTSDIIAGLFLAKDKDFECGFRVKVGDIEGTVEKIDIRKIRIKNDKGNIIVLPSSKVDSLGWTVLSKN